MVDISATISIDVFCGDCGGTLDAEHNQHRDEIIVQLCDSCLQAKYNEGVTDGSEAAE